MMAARAFARSDFAALPQDDSIADAKMMGATAAQIANLKAQINAADGNFENEFKGLWPDHVAGFEAFLVASSQWRTTIASHRGRVITLFQALDYAAAHVAWAIHGMVISGVMLNQIATLQSAVADIWNEEALQ